MATTGATGGAGCTTLQPQLITQGDVLDVEVQITLRCVIAGNQGMALIGCIAIPVLGMPMKTSDKHSNHLGDKTLSFVPTFFKCILLLENNKKSPKRRLPSKPWRRRGIMENIKNNKIIWKKKKFQASSLLNQNILK